VVKKCENLRLCLEIFGWLANDLTITSYWMSRKAYEMMGRVPYKPV
jgi:hypothetical protein